MSLVIWIAVILLVLVLVTLFRVGTLMDVMKKKNDDEDSGNRINASIFVLFFIGGLTLFGWYSIAEYDNYTLPLASVHGEMTDALFWWTTAVVCFVFIGVHVLIVLFAFKYQHKKDNKATFVSHNNKVEVIWTVIPFIVLTLLLGTGFKTWYDIFDKAPSDAEVVEVTAYQFAFQSRYPGKDGKLGNRDYTLIDAENLLGMDFTDQASNDDFTPGQIHIPKGKPVVFKIRANDVIHSVYVPHFRMQMNAVPGMPTQFWFVPTKTTAEMAEEVGDPDFQYELVCNKICGRGHFGMRHIIVVDEEEDYKKWYASQKSWTSMNPDYVAKVLKNAAKDEIVSASLSTSEN